ncbi:MAG: RtcB family protein [Myxococcales bacterium]|nr:RtcB family protein [Myxococcales bacterium]
MESAALDQLQRVAAMAGCRRAVGMPDLHPGRGIPIGAAFAFDGVIRPGLVGGDAGCGALVVPVRRPKHSGDGLLRRVASETEGAVLPELSRETLLGAAWALGPAGLLALDGVPDGLVALVDQLAVPDGLPESSLLPSGAAFADQLGTAGGGNHFVEISEVTSVADHALASRWGLERHSVAVVAHSGSRQLGAVLAERWHDRELRAPEEQAAYLADLAGCIRYARTNRVLLAWRLLSALGATREAQLGPAFDLVHNGVSAEAGLAQGACTCFLHRKGCAPADSGEATIVLGSRGTVSWVMEGLGNDRTLSSVAHGAGRRMTRSEAVHKLRERHRRATLTRTKSGGTVLCDDPELLYAEHPDAYKPIEPVITSLEAAGAARRVAALMPVVNVKR